MENRDPSFVLSSSQTDIQTYEQTVSIALSSQLPEIINYELNWKKSVRFIGFH